MPDSAIFYDLFPSPIGVCGVLVGPRGLMRVFLPVGGARAMDRSVKAQSPGARRSVSRCRRAAAAVRRCFDSGGTPDPGPLDTRGMTELERAIYVVARKVPAGGVVTYGELARRAGRPRAARAVGRAMARNPLPLVIPCHRVVRSDGGLGGYSAPGGVALKRALLERESALNP